MWHEPTEQVSRQGNDGSEKEISRHQGTPRPPGGTGKPYNGRTASREWQRKKKSISEKGNISPKKAKPKKAQKPKQYEDTITGSELIALIDAESFDAEGLRIHKTPLHRDEYDFSEIIDDLKKLPRDAAEMLVRHEYAREIKQYYDQLRAAYVAWWGEPSSGRAGFDFEGSEPMRQIAELVGHYLPMRLIDIKRRLGSWETSTSQKPAFLDYLKYLSTAMEAPPNTITLVEEASRRIKSLFGDSTPIPASISLEQEMLLRIMGHPNFSPGLPAIRATSSFDTDTKEELFLRFVANPSLALGIEGHSRGISFHGIRIDWSQGKDKIITDFRRWIDEHDLPSKKGRPWEVIDRLHQLAAWRAHRAGMNSDDYLIARADPLDEHGLKINWQRLKVLDSRKAAVARLPQSGGPAYSNPRDFEKAWRDVEKELETVKNLRVNNRGS